MIITENLKFQYNKQESPFNFPDIDLNSNENLLILGKSGIGKTTFLHLLAGLLTPTEGKVVINNTEINSLSQSKLDKFRGEHIGMVFQQKHAVQSLTVVDNLKARLFFSKKTLNDSKIETLLNSLDLLHCKNKKTNEISEGQLQRLGIALAVIHNPQVILADEPTSSLDDDNCKTVIELLIQQAAETKANLIVITHDQRIKSFFSNTITL